MKTKDLVKSGTVAALYVVLVLLFSATSFGPVQFRIAEALTVLPIFFPQSVVGLFIGCLLANIIGGAVLPDIILGSLTTFFAAQCTFLLRKQFLLAILPPILLNSAMIGFLLRFAYHIPASLIELSLSVLYGQIVSVGLFGWILYKTLRKVFPDRAIREGREDIS